MSCLFDILSKQSKGEPYSCVRVYLYIFSNLLEKKNRSTELTGRKHLQKWHRFTTTQKFGQKERKKTREKKTKFIYACETFRDSKWDAKSRFEVRACLSIAHSRCYSPGQCVLKIVSPVSFLFSPSLVSFQFSIVKTNSKYSKT